MTSALVAAGNAAALALSGSAGVFSTAVSGAQRTWKIAAATANGNHNTDQAVAKYSVKMAEWWAEQGQSDPVSTAAGIVNTLVTAIAGAESTAATTMGNALTTAVTTIGTADVAGVTTVTNADKTYSTESVGNDKTYLDGMATGEADYLKVVANKWHEFRTGAITAAERDSAISAKWTEFQAAAITKRNTFRVDQASDAATFRNAVVGAEKTHVDAVTTAGETLNDGLQNAQKTLSTSKWNAWLTASKGLVNLDAESTIAKAESLADAIEELATENRVSGSSGSGQTQTNWSAPNPFWTALAAKADQSAEYIADTKNAERLYYGRSPWSDNVNGAIIDHPSGTRGVLDARRDYEVGMADATATQNKALQHTAGTRDRELAAAAVQLAQSRGAYEISWANLNLESSNWHLDQSALPITGADDGRITVTPDAGTNFVPGWFSVPRISESGSSSSTSTGFNATDLDQYFTAGLMPDMPGTDPVSSGKVLRDDSAFTHSLGIPAQQNSNQTKPTAQPVVVEEGDDPAYNPPTRSIPLAIVPNGQLAVADDIDGVTLAYLPVVPGDFDASLPLLPPELIIDPVLIGGDSVADVQLDPFNFGQRTRLSQIDEPERASIIAIVVLLERTELLEPDSPLVRTGEQPTLRSLEVAETEAVIRDDAPVDLDISDLEAPWSEAGVIRAFEHYYGDDPQAMTAFYALMSSYKLEHVSYWNDDYDTPDFENGIIRVNEWSGWNLYNWKARTNANVADQVHEIMRLYFPELRAKVARNWGEMGWDVSAGSGKTVVGGIGGVLGALGAIFDPEPLTKVGSGMLSASSFSYAGEGLSQIFNLGPAGGFNPLHEAFGAWGRMINGAEGEASSRYWLGWGELLLGASQLLGPTQAGKFRFGAGAGVLGNAKGFGSAVRGDFATLRELVRSMQRYKARHVDGQHWRVPYSESHAASANAAVREAQIASGLGGQDLFDVIQARAGQSGFTIDKAGRRILFISTSVLDDPNIGMLLREAAHELVHAQQYQKLLTSLGGDWKQARYIFIVVNHQGTLRYAIDEAVAETLARQRIQVYLGKLSNRTIEWSNLYLLKWRKITKARR